MLDRISEHLGFYQRALDLRAQRQEVLSSNIANADTPGYQARDFDFDQALLAAESQRGLPATSLTRTSVRHIASKASRPVDEPELQYRLPLQASLDGNTVDMDVERVNFADNTLHYQSNLTLLTSRIKGLQSAMVDSQS
jgi:flagellar basal-body rod protein FlgB